MPISWDDCKYGLLFVIIFNPNHRWQFLVALIFKKHFLLTGSFCGKWIFQLKGNSLYLFRWYYLTETIQLLMDCVLFAKSGFPLSSSSHYSTFPTLPFFTSYHNPSLSYSASIIGIIYRILLPNFLSCFPKANQSFEYISNINVEYSNSFWILIPPRSVDQWLAPIFRTTLVFFAHDAWSCFPGFERK